MTTTRTVTCAKLHKTANGLTRAPYPGELGKKIYEEISEEAWDLWLKQQTMFINEYRLDLTEPKSREFLKTEMNKFLFQDIDEKPIGYREK